MVIAIFMVRPIPLLYFRNGERGRTTNASLEYQNPKGNLNGKSLFILRRFFLFTHSEVISES